MPALKTILFALLGIIILIIATSLVFNFLGIEFAAYGNYLLWLIALAIFYVVLPTNNNNIFM